MMAERMEMENKRLKIENEQQKVRIAELENRVKNLEAENRRILTNWRKGELLLFERFQASFRSIKICERDCRCSIFNCNYWLFSDADFDPGTRLDRYFDTSHRSTANGLRRKGPSSI